MGHERSKNQTTFHQKIQSLCSVGLVATQSYSYAKIGRHPGINENNNASTDGLTLEQLETELKRLQKKHAA
ncbi:MAG: hypothetical protein CSA34_05170 [Desulfobulbus propionicus]|nr:MAG: hypothetical protein CSA34_05170 [Desulfobulbus propionicus]